MSFLNYVRHLFNLLKDKYTTECLENIAQLEGFLRSFLESGYSIKVRQSDRESKIDDQTYTCEGIRQ